MDEVVPDEIVDQELPSKAPRLLETSDVHESLKTMQVDQSDNGSHIECAPTDTEAPSIILPEGWVAVRHESGGVVYLHKPSRVCTWSRPYTVSTSTTIKKHKVPLASIPCLEQCLVQPNDSELSKNWHKEFAMKDQKLHPRFKIEPNKLSEYIKIRWPTGVPLVSEREVNHKSRQSTAKRTRNSDQIIVPQAISKVITIDVPKEYIKPDADGKKSLSVWTVNINLKPAVSILLEFCQRYLRNEVHYVTEETTSGQTPYCCTAVIGGVHYGSGSGPSKKSAKQLAAEATLDLFLPGTFKDAATKKVISDEELEYLSKINIDDPQSASFLSQAGLPSPWQLLRECYQRRKCNGVGEPQFSVELLPSTSSADSTKMKFMLSCGSMYEVTGDCCGRKDGQQLAAQKMLKLLHPHLHYWDSLFKLYADSHSKLPKLITERQCLDILQIHNTSNNEELLKHLHSEMRKLDNK